MSGHSKWANIRVKKTAQDAKRGKIFTRHARLIEIVARSGGGDITSNAALRTAIENAKSESVPNANIERAIKKGTGELKGDAMQELTYEAYGPGGAAFIIECLSDNKNRTLTNVKTLLSKNGGRFAENGSVMWMFERKGVIDAKGLTGPLGDDMELSLIELGAEDIGEADGHVHVMTPSAGWTGVRDHLTASHLEIESAGLRYIAKQTAPVDSATLEKIQALMDLIEEDDDVSEVHTNAVLA